MSVSLQRGATRGFTLLEILVALTVLGFLMIALVQGVRTGTEFWKAQTRRSAEIAELDPSGRVLRAILTTIPIQPAADGAPIAIGFEGHSDKITLVGELPTGLGISRRVDMTIHLQASLIVISWAPHRHEIAQATARAPAVAELIRGVDRLEFAYWGKASLTSPAAWLPSWDDLALPELIRVRVRFRKGDNRHWPDLIVAPELSNPSG